MNYYNKKYTDAHLKAYSDFLIADYNKYSAAADPSHFSVEFENGSKYVRVVTVSWNSRSAHTFIDADGNIWKAASWKAPSKNFTRGNIIMKDYSRISWTGAN